MTEISVIICTHNPREDYLRRTLEALRGQTLSKDLWELVIVDNGSTQPLVAGAVEGGKVGRWEGANEGNVEKCESGKVGTREPESVTTDEDSARRSRGQRVKVNLGWHAGARIAREEVLGLTQARLRGIAESRGELLVFVDDDNVLRADYLEQAVSLAKQWPQLGAWSGRVVPEYEVAPAKELQPYLWRLCIREVTGNVWGNEGSFESTPWGAGMCVRRAVAEKYAQETRRDIFKASLDRRGESLGSTGDVDLALTSLDLGLGTGVFASLEVLHLIPERRVQEPYLLKLIEDSEAGGMVFARGKQTQSSRGSGIDRLVMFYKQLRGTRLQRAVGQAFARGQSRGQLLAKELESKADK